MRRSGLVLRQSIRRFTTHEMQIKVLEHGPKGGVPITCPNSDVITPRHFYQTAIQEKAAIAQRPVSLRQLAFFGRKLTAAKIIMSANYIREELTVRVAHRIVEMQGLPYKIVSNPHLTTVYEIYVRAFEKLRKIPKIETLDDNREFCAIISTLLEDNSLAVPDLLLGIIELGRFGNIEKPEDIDSFVKSMLMSRISRRVIAEQHVSLSRAYDNGITNDDKDQDYIGDVFLQCNTQEVIGAASKRIENVMKKFYPDLPLPKVIQEGEPTSFPYIQSHLEYVIGEVLRNSIQASMNVYLKNKDTMKEPSPVVFSVSSTKDNVFIRISDRGGGISPNVLGSIFHFAKPQMETEITKHKLEVAWPQETSLTVSSRTGMHRTMQQLNDRDPNAKLGIGLALSRVYTEYWDGALEIHSLEGYGCDALLRISRLGTKLENLHLNRI